MPRLPPVAACLALLAAACSGPQVGAEAPVFAPPDQAKCSVSKSRARPLVVEWPSADRAALESQARRGLVAVRYVGCEMEVLPRCRAPGHYGYAGLTRKRDRIVIKNEDDLYANIPVYAAKFEGKLRSAGQLNVAMTIVGQYEADRTELADTDLVGDCDEATHVVTTITAGAFEFFAGADAAAAAGVDAAGAGAGARTATRKETLTQDGEESTCAKATTGDRAPPDGCGALLRVEVAPVARREAPAPVAKPGSAPPAAAKVAPEPASCPSDMAKVKGGSMGLAPRTVRVGGFCLDREEVSGTDYTDCVNRGKCSAEGLRCGAQSTYFTGQTSLPINCVDHAEAASYCEIQGKRLPTEIEWEWAARGGPRALPYPWGLGPNTIEGRIPMGAEKPVQVSYSNGSESADGIRYLVGNVWEWTSTDAGSGGRVVRGGSYQEKDAAGFAITAARAVRPAGERSVAVGFRCAR